MIGARLVSVSKRPLTYGDLATGDIFFDFYGELYMTIDEIRIGDDEEDIYNAVNLASGELNYFSHEGHIRKLNKNVTIEYSLEDIVESVE